MIRVAIIGLFIGLISLVACKKQVEFDKKELLENIINDYVLESYDEVVEKTTILKQAVEQFTNSPDLVKLEAAQEAWKNSMNAWSKVEGLDFGPGRSLYRYLQVDNTPVRAASIETALMDSITINLSYLQDRSSYTKGLSTVEYLLFESNDNSINLQRYQTDPHATRRQDYLYYTVVHALDLLEIITMDWKNSYAIELASQTGDETTGGIGRFTNVLCHLTQTIARKKIGKPLGKENSTGMVQPTLVESPYAQHSWTIIHYNLLGLQEIFGEEARGMGSYLTSLLDDNSNTEKIAKQLEKVVALTNQRANSLQLEVTTQTTDVELFYTEMKVLYDLLIEEYLPYVSVSLLINPDDGD